MASPLDRFGGVGGMIRKAVPFVATYLFGRKMGERGTRKQADEEISEQRGLGEKGRRRFATSSTESPPATTSAARTSDP
jgi:hypothetical protein